MAKRATLRDDIHQIEEVLRKLLADEDRVYVFEAPGEYVRAIVVSDRFAGRDAATRQEDVWAHLKRHLSDDVRMRLWGVHPLTWDEYEQDFEQGSLSADVDLP